MNSTSSTYLFLEPVINYTPRVIATLATIVALSALITLSTKMNAISGTTAVIEASFKTGCLETAKWSGIVCAGAVGVGLVKDIGLHLVRRHLKYKESEHEFKEELILTLFSPFFALVGFVR